MVLQKILWKLESCGQNNNRKDNTIFIDLDGTLVIHRYDNFELDCDSLLPGAIEKLLEMRRKNYYIILTTGRMFSDCTHILNHLKKNYLFEFDKIVDNLPTGKRIIINDYIDCHKAQAINVKRNEGVKSLYV